MLTCSRAHVPYVPYMTACLRAFTCLTCPHFFTCLMCLHILRAYILSMYMLIKFTQINELLSTFIRYFYIYKTGVIFYMKFSLFETKNINYFNAEENTRSFQRLELYLEREIQGKLKSFTIRHNKKIFTLIFG